MKHVHDWCASREEGRTSVGLVKLKAVVGVNAGELNRMKAVLNTKILNPDRESIAQRAIEAQSFIDNHRDSRRVT